MPRLKDYEALSTAQIRKMPSHDRTIYNLVTLMHEIQFQACCVFASPQDYSELNYQDLRASLNDFKEWVENTNRGWIEDGQ